MRINLTGKLVIVIEAMVVLLSIMVSIGVNYVIKSIFEEKTYSQLQSVVVLKEERIKGFLEQISDEIDYFAGNKDSNRILVDYLVNKDEKSKNEVHSEFVDELKFENLLTRFSLLDINGSVIYSSDPENEGKIYSDQPFFINGKVNTFVQDYYFDVTSGFPVMSVSSPVKDGTGKVLGVLVGRVNTNEINKLMLERSGLGKTGESVLVNSSNIVVTDLLKIPGQAMKRTIFNIQIDRCLKGETFSGPFVDYNGDPVYGYYHWVPEIRSCIATKIDQSEVLSSFARLYGLIIPIILIVALIVGVIGFLMGKVILKPLSVLKDKVQMINAGNFNAYTGITTKDEIGELARSFDDMAMKLKSSYISLEANVSQKTKELQEKLEEVEKLNSLMQGREIKMIELKNKIKALEEQKNPTL